MRIRGRLRFYITRYGATASLLVDDAFWIAKYTTIENGLTALLLAGVISVEDSDCFLAAAEGGTTQVRNVHVPIALLGKCGFHDSDTHHGSSSGLGERCITELGELQFAQHPR